MEETRIAVRSSDPTRLMLGKDSAGLLDPQVVYRVVRSDTGQLVLEVAGPSTALWLSSPDQLATNGEHLRIGAEAYPEYSCNRRAARVQALIDAACAEVDMGVRGPALAALGNVVGTSDPEYVRLDAWLGWTPAPA